MNTISTFGELFGFGAPEFLLVFGTVLMVALVIFGTRYIRYLYKMFLGK